MGGGAAGFALKPGAIDAHAIMEEAKVGDSSGNEKALF